LIIESVGGKTLANVLSFLAKGTTCVTLGRSASPETTIDFRDMIVTGRITFYVLNMFEEFNHRDGSDLAWLAQMVAEQKIQTPIEASWHEISNIAQRSLQRQFTGKAVLHLSK
jgi:NADPH2:quinone reductase